MQVQAVASLQALLVNTRIKSSTEITFAYSKAHTLHSEQGRREGAGGASKNATVGLVQK